MSSLISHFTLNVYGTATFMSLFVRRRCNVCRLTLLQTSLAITGSPITRHSRRSGPNHIKTRRSLSIRHLAGGSDPQVKHPDWLHDLEFPFDAVCPSGMDSICHRIRVRRSDLVAL